MAIYYARANGNVNATNVWSTTPSGATSDLFPSFTSSDTLMANGFTITLNVNTTVLEIRTDTTGGATAGGSFTLNSNITLNANVYSGSTTCLSCVAVAGTTSTINGNVTGPSTGLNQSGASMTGAGTLNIIGNIIGPGIQANSVVLNSGGIINITGSVTGGAANNSVGVSNIGTGTINITGNLLGGGGSNASAVSISAAAGIVNVTGSVTGGTIFNSYGIVSSSNSTITIVGIVTGGTAGVGAFNNNGTGTMTITRAKGNGFGNGSTGLISTVGVAAVQTGLTRVYEIEYGSLGQSPTSGPIELVNANSNVAVFAVRLSTPKTLVDLNNAVNLIPSSGDVRSGTSYNYGNNSGVCVIPNPNSVVYGVPVDNTVGSGLLSPVAVWNALTSAIGTSGSIGERLKNCSTVATVGKQLEGVL